MRQPHLAGEKLFVDFAGRTGMVVDAPTAPRHRQEDAFKEEDCVTCSPMLG
jgi:hypothetical protein